jgi:hypothetical protein
MMVCCYCKVEKNVENFKSRISSTKVFKSCEECRRDIKARQMCEHGKFKSCCYSCTNPSKLRLRKMVISTRQSDILYNRYVPSEHINYEHLKELLFESMQKCYHCGNDMQLEHYKDDLCTIERIDNSRGHVIGNCVFACRTCNYKLSKAHTKNH